MIKLALVGKQISHSLSPRIYKELLKYPHSYELLDYENEEEIPPLDKILENLDGLNITSPYKLHFNRELLNVPLNFPINVIKKNIDGSYSATNTDMMALRVLLPQIIKQYNISAFAILGDGVMSKITQQLLSDHAFTHKVFSRRSNNLDTWPLMATDVEKLLVINACSRDFVCDAFIPENVVWFDYNYNTSNTATMADKLTQRFIDGKELLIMQAKEAINFWNF